MKAAFGNNTGDADECENAGHRDVGGMDHIIPLSWGGSDATDNMQLLPIEVHRAKTRAEISCGTVTSICTR